MGEYAIKMPDIGEGIAECELVEWHVRIGDEIEADTALADVTTDKATVQIPSPTAGTVLQLGAEPGEFVAVGSELIRLAVSGPGNVSPAKPAKGRAANAPKPAPKAADPAADVPSPEPAPTEPAPTEPGDREPPGAASGEPAPVTADRARDTKPASTGQQVLASPAVRARAKEAGVDLGSVRGSRPEQRVTAADLAAHLGSAAAGSAASAGSPGSAEVEEIPVIGIRRMTAQRMQEAWRRIPHITIVEEVDVTDLESLRTKLGDNRPKLTVLPFLMRAVVRAVQEQPGLNAHYDDEAQVVKRFRAVHLGIAAQGPDGLKVPVIRNADALDLWDSAAQLADLSAAAREGRATREQLSGSTITITSLGPLGAIATTPIINRPEVAIVGVNRMATRPLWDGSTFVPRTVLNLSSSFDHRVVDGWEAAVFVARLKELLETPALLFLEAGPPDR